MTSAKWKMNWRKVLGTVLQTAVGGFGAVLFSIMTMWVANGLPSEVAGWLYIIGGACIAGALFLLAEHLGALNEEDYEQGTRAKNKAMKGAKGALESAEMEEMTAKFEEIKEVPKVEIDPEPIVEIPLPEPVVEPIPVAAPVPVVEPTPVVAVPAPETPPT